MQGLRESKYRLRFVDVGCGPFTSGLALLALIEKFEHPISVEYIGVDRSIAMLSKAKSVANFAQRRIRESESDISLETTFLEDFDSYSKIREEDGELVVFNFCYVMSSNFEMDLLIRQLLFALNKGSASRKLVFYQNPLSQDLETKWPALSKKLIDFSYVANAPSKLSVRYLDRCNTWPNDDGYSSRINVDSAVLERSSNGR